MMATDWLDQAQTTINRVRITGYGEEPQALAMRTERLLATTTLGAGILPPSAILVVRHLRDPLAGQWRLPRVIESQPVRSWQQAVANALEAAARSAARPIDGAVAAAAAAVVFSDPAEVLACLASDWLEGSLASRWWWQSLLGTPLKQGGTAALLTAWLKAAHAIPAALDLLAHRRAAQAFVQALSDDAALALARAVAATFGLAGIPAALAPSEVNRQHAASARLAGPPSPWQAWAPEADGPELGKPQALLLGLGLGLQRAPASVRRAAFGREVASWMATPSPLPVASTNLHSAALGADAAEGTVVPVDRRELAGHPAVPPAGVATRPTAAYSRRPGGQPAAEPEPSSAVRGSEGFRGVPVAPDPGGALSAAPHAGQQEDAGTGSLNGPELVSDLPQSGDENIQESEASADTGQQATGGDVLRPGRSHPPAGPDSLQAGSDLVAPVTVPVAEPFEVVVTGYGGVFYLIPLALYLGLYGDFTAPLQPGIELSLYDFVALVADGLCVDRAALRGDPVWPLLARLAGRSEEDPPGMDFEPPDGTSLDHWLTALLATVRKRLHRALGTPDADRSGLARLLLAQPARVTVTPTRLDIAFALDQHPIEIRLSGLDRDPGWVPAAGRIVAFHYE